MQTYSCLRGTNPGVDLGLVIQLKSFVLCHAAHYTQGRLKESDLFPSIAGFIKNDLLWLMCCKLVNLPRICEFDKTSHKM